MALRALPDVTPQRTALIDQIVSLITDTGYEVDRVQLATKETEALQRFHDLLVFKANPGRSTPIRKDA